LYPLKYEKRGRNVDGCKYGAKNSLEHAEKMSVTPGRHTKKLGYREGGVSFPRFVLRPYYLGVKSKKKDRL